MLNKIQERCQSISELSAESMRKAAERLDDLTKPKGSLGVLESLIIRLSGMTDQVIPSTDHPGGIIFAADHGVSAEGVSAYGAEVTGEMTVNMCRGGAVSSVLSRAAHVNMRVVDVGVRSEVRHPDAVVRKVAPGTNNFAIEGAMTLEQAYQCVNIGMETAEELLDKNINVLILGEMGIGNTTTASAMASVLLDIPVHTIVGRGTGIGDAQLHRKIEVIQDAIRKHRVKASDPWDVLSAVGGFEIGAMAGAMIAAASRRIPLVLDGVIAGVAALWASRLHADVKHYFIASHCSQEPAHSLILKELDLEPLVRWEMRLGEGSGALLLLPLLQNACRIMAETATFSEAQVSTSLEE